MKEWNEFKEVQEQNKEGVEERLEGNIQELLKKADALIDSSAKLLAEDSPLTKEEIIEQVQEDALKELGPGYTKEDVAPVGTFSKSYAPSFGAWSSCDSKIRCTTTELTQDVKAGREIAVKNDIKKIRELERKREEEEKKKREKKAQEVAGK